MTKTFCFSILTSLSYLSISLRLLKKTEIADERFRYEYKNHVFFYYIVEKHIGSACQANSVSHADRLRMPVLDPY